MKDVTLLEDSGRTSVECDNIFVLDSHDRNSDLLLNNLIYESNHFKREIQSCRALPYYSCPVSSSNVSKSVTETGMIPESEFIAQLGGDEKVAANSSACLSNRSRTNMS